MKHELLGFAKERSTETPVAVVSVGGQRQMLDETSICRFIEHSSDSRAQAYLIETLGKMHEVMASDERLPLISGPHDFGTPIQHEQVRTGQLGKSAFAYGNALAVA